MELESIEAYCLSKKGTNISLKFDNLLCYCVAEKIYAAISLDNTPMRLTFKTGVEHFDIVTEDPLFIQAPYFAKRQWVTCLDMHALTASQMQEYIDRSYQLIYSKLSKKLQQSILENE